MAGYLRAAAVVIAEKGYDQATMSSIAQHADPCIGSLYQLFPSKRSVAAALRAQDIEEVDQSWAATLSAEHVAVRLLGLQIRIVTSHPAFLALLDAAPTVRTPVRRELIRARLATVLIGYPVPKLTS